MSADVDWSRPLVPGPVKEVAGSLAHRARLVREAIEHVAMSPSISAEEHWALIKVARVASDGALAALGRLLK